MKIVNWQTLNTSEQADLLQRPQSTASDKLKSAVDEIITRVRREGDRALYALTQQFDGVELENLMITSDEIEQAIVGIDDEIVAAMELAIARISDYHRQCLPADQQLTITPVNCQRLFRPVERVGLYVPGGSAPLISTLMMIALPAQIAGCPLRVLCTPPGSDGKVDPRLLLAAKLCGIETIFVVGGAQAIAAMAYGTETIPNVDKLFGPGNRWVMAAKLAVAQDPQGANIDLPAGPSEVMVIADRSADATFVAADLLAQAEHGSDSQVLLVTDSQFFAETVIDEVVKQLPLLSRCAIALQSLQHSKVIVVDNIEQAFAISNRYAPEHLILQLTQAQHYLPCVKAAGAVFIGNWTPEALGDYISGSNHVLPTSGYARSYSGLCVEDYLVAISVQQVDQQGFAQLAEATMTLAQVEGLDAHRQAVALRLKKLRVEA
ncbi:MAG: histidinol dehydrogenase [Gammaproteobacteria bacterium]|nr:histidinol dehydrogenase [Gammaproteobacteria bacterium]